MQVLSLIKSVLTTIIREGIKKRIFYGQADRKRLPPSPPPSYGHLFVNFFLVYFWPQIMILCVLKWILYNEKVISMLAAALSQNGRIAV